LKKMNNKFKIDFENKYDDLISYLCVYDFIDSSKYEKIKNILESINKENKANYIESLLQRSDLKYERYGG